MCSNGLAENDEDCADMATTFEVEAEHNVVPFNWHIPMLPVISREVQCRCRRHRFGKGEARAGPCAKKPIGYLYVGW